MGKYQQYETIKDQRSYDARIWWALWAIALLVLIFTVWHTVRQRDLIRNGNCIEADYYTYNGQELARYIDPEGRIYSFNVSGLSTVHLENTVLLYYKDQISLAEPQINPKLFLACYIGFGLALVLISCKLVKIYKSPYYANEVQNSNPDSDFY